MKNTYYLSFLLLFAALSAIAQVSPSKYIIFFTDKSGSPFSVSSPSEFLSQRAIDRRTKQNIPVVENDLPVNPSYISSVTNTGVKFLNKSKWLNSVTIYAPDTSVLAQIRSFSFVKKVSPVALPKYTGTGTPSDKFKVLDHADKDLPSSNRISSVFDYNYGASYNQINMIAGDFLHNKGYKGENMVIAVLDAGFYNVNTLPAFDSIRNNNQILGTWDFVANDNSVFEDNAHGMMVLSTMAANIPGELVGTAPKAKYWLLRSEDVFSEYLIEEYNWVAAAEFADSVGADIINSSLGYTQFDDPAQDHSYADMDGNTTVVTRGADMAASKGILVINSAGNSGSSSWYYIGAPADGDSVFAIGAVDSTRSYVSFSSKGPSSDGQIKPNVAAQGAGVVVASAFSGIQRSSGTSFSSPIIAGTSACLWQAFPDLTNVEIMRAIEKSASQNNNPDIYLGYGIPNYSTAFNELTGVNLEEVNERPVINIYPNPFTGDRIRVIFYASDTNEMTVTLSDTRGRKVMQDKMSFTKNSFNEVNLAIPQDLNKGMYFLHFSSPTFSSVDKVVKVE